MTKPFNPKSLKGILDKIRNRLEESAKRSDASLAAKGAQIRLDLLNKPYDAKNFGGFSDIAKAFGKDFALTMKNKKNLEETLANKKLEETLVKIKSCCGKTGGGVPVKQQKFTIADGKSQTNPALRNAWRDATLLDEVWEEGTPVHETLFGRIVQPMVCLGLLVFMYLSMAVIESNLFPQNGPWTSAHILGDTVVSEIDYGVQQVTQGTSMVNEWPFGGAAASLLQNLYSEAGVIGDMQILNTAHLSGSQVTGVHASEPPSPEAIQNIYNTLMANEDYLPGPLIETALLFMGRILMRYQIGIFAPEGGGKRKTRRRRNKRSKRRNKKSKKRVKHRKNKRSKRRNKKSKKHRR